MHRTLGYVFNLELARVVCVWQGTRSGTAGRVDDQGKVGASVVLDAMSHQLLRIWRLVDGCLAYCREGPTPIRRARHRGGRSLVTLAGLDLTSCRK